MQNAHRGRYTRVQRACTRWTCAHAHVCTSRAHTGYTCMHAHTQSAYTGFTHERAPMLTPNVCTRVCAPTQRASAEATPQSEQGEAPGDAGITAVFLASTTLRAPPEPPLSTDSALLWSTHSQPPWPPSFWPGSGHQGQALVDSMSLAPLGSVGAAMRPACHLLAGDPSNSGRGDTSRSGEVGSGL